MSTTSPTTPGAASDRPTKHPEKKIGPFAGGVGVAIWLNQAEMPDGTIRAFRSITIAPRRYFDKESNQWKDAPSYNPADLPALIFSLERAQAFCYEQPVPGEDGSAEEQERY